MRCSILAVVAAVSCALMPGASLAENGAENGAKDLPNPEQLAALSKRFAPVDVTVDLSSLPAQERAALAKLVEASRYIDALFMRQRFAGNNALLFAQGREREW
jgi:hypothetical protein